MGAGGPAEYTDGVKESRKSKDPQSVWPIAPARLLGARCSRQSDESKRLPDSGEQLGAVEVLEPPRGGVQRVQPGSDAVQARPPARRRRDQTCAATEVQP